MNTIEYPRYLKIGQALLASLAIVSTLWGADASQASQLENGMLFADAKSVTIGTSKAERIELAKKYNCDFTWLSNDSERADVELAAHWIDAHPVTNAQYWAFVEATGARKPWPLGAFPLERANHPVVGMTIEEAENYAKWVGKRLPTANEWEAASQSSLEEVLYPWGDRWPGPLGLPKNLRPDWDLPGTSAVGSGDFGRSPIGFEDFYGQVSEYTGTRTPTHIMTKGASWIHRDPINFRTAAGSFVHRGYQSPALGFRCAMDGDGTPPAISQSLPADMPSLDELTSAWSLMGKDSPKAHYTVEMPVGIERHLTGFSKRFSKGTDDGHHSRGFVLNAPYTGPWAATFFFFETANWNEKRILLGHSPDNPEFQSRQTENGYTEYFVDMGELDATCHFEPGPDYIDLVVEVRNKTNESGRFRASSCLSLMSHANFYDCESERTYALSGNGDFVRLREANRPGVNVRWISATELGEYGGLPKDRAVMAVESRDGKYTFGSVNKSTAATFNQTGNMWINCLHCDGIQQMEPKQTVGWRQRFYFLEGGLEDLSERIEKDVSRGDFDVSG